MQQKKFKKDYYGGALMVLIGLSAVYAAMGYRIGSLSQMGPGFFPAAVGTLMAITGLLIALSARGDKPKEDHGPSAHPTTFPDLRAGFCIILSIVAFILLGHYGGLIPATFAIVFISGLGDRTNTVMQVLVLSIIMCVVAAGVFWWALQLQLPLFQWGG
jgi:hypothetical protein